MIFALYQYLKSRLCDSVKGITGPLEKQIKTIEDLTDNLNDRSKFTIERTDSNLVEMCSLNNSISDLLAKINELEEDVKAKSYGEAKAKLTKVLAHNIRGSLASLQLRVNSLDHLSSEERKNLSQIVSKVLSAAEAVLSANRSEINEPEITAIEIVPLVQSIVTEMKLKNPVAKINFVTPAKSAKVRSVESELSSILENLIQNSLEAIGAAGVIDVYMEEVDKGVRLVVRDNGKGMPSEVLARIGQEEVTWGKRNGNGLGLFHASQSIRNWNGLIKVESEESKGTTVSIVLPLVQEMNRALGVVSLKAGMEVILVDDDDLVHASLRTFFGGLEGEMKPSAIYSLFSPKQFHEWVKTNGLGEYGKRLYVFDYDLKDANENGLDLIETYGVNLESIFYSGSNEEAVFERAKKLGVRTLLKGKDNFENALLEVKRKEVAV